MSRRAAAAAFAIMAAVGLAGDSVRAQIQPRPGDPSADGIWQSVDTVPGAAARVITAGQFALVRLNRPTFEDLASRTPFEQNRDAAGGEVMTLPMPDGTFARFRIVESPILEADLAAAFPEIRTYHGQGIDDPTATARFGWTAAGFHAIVLSASGTVYVDPQQPGELDYYISASKGDLQQGGAGFVCLLEGTTGVEDLARPVNQFPFTNGTSLRTYRLALAATAEYTAAAGGTKELALARMTTTMNRVNGVYEREVAVRMTLLTGTLADPTALIFTDSATDGYTNGEPSVMLGQNPGIINLAIGDANYDIGHVFGIGGGGVASLSSPCGSSKARGVSASSSPTGDFFDVDLVAHEFGHQFGANHTFNGTAGSCANPNRSALHAFEVGSGSTIMSYSGSCSEENLQFSSNDLFHVESLNEMTAFLTAGGGATCGTPTATGNTPPTLSATSAFTIPADTPFTLTTASSDINGDALTYSWEERDLGTASSSVITASTDDGSRPLFRAYAPTASPSRVFPSLTYVLNNANVPPTTLSCFGSGTCLRGEVLPSTNRIMNFHVTARDNRAGGGGIATTSRVITVDATSGPFQVTSPNTAISVVGGSLQTMTWNANGTNAGSVNVTNVKISLSIDGGTTFPLVLAASTPNDGSQGVTIANAPTSAARVKVEAVDNIFFDVSDVNFTITAPGPAPPAPSGLTATPISPTRIDLAWTDNSSDETSFSLEGSPDGSSWTEISTPPANATASINSVLACNMIYYYRLRAYRTSDNQFSTYSNTANATTQACPVPSVTVTPATIAVGGSVSATFANGPALGGDWWGIFLVGAADTAYCRWGYMNGLATRPNPGLSGATLPIATCAAAGSYEVRWFRDDSFTRLATSTSIDVVNPTVSASPASVGTGTSVNVTFANGPGLTGDWWGVYLLGAANGAYCRWGYMNGLASRPSPGLSGAVLTVAMCATPGSYEVRWFRNDTFTLIATSSPVTVLSPTVTVGPITVSTFGSVDATFANGPALLGDWWGVFQVGAADSAYCRWGYMNGLQGHPNSGVAGVTLPIAMCGPAGSYEVRWFRNDSSVRLATSSAFAVVNPTVAVSPGGLMPNASITATFNNGPMLAGDWWGIALTTQSESQYCQWGYMGGLHTKPSPPVSGAVMSIAVTGACATPGNYEVRWYRNDSLSRIATSPTFIVANPSISLDPTTVPGGGTVTTTFNNGPGLRGDWCAVFAVGSPNSVYFTWWYLNGLQTMPASGLTGSVLPIPMPSGPGSYNIRCFRDNSATLLATSATVTVP